MIKQRIRIHKEKLLDELEPAAIVFALSKTNASLKGALDSVRKARSCNTRIHLLLILVEEGSPDFVEEFLSTLKKLGYSEIVKLIDPESVDNKPGKFILNCVALFLMLINEYRHNCNTLKHNLLY